MNKQEQKLEISGMTCGHCAKTVQRTFMSVDGVESASVSYENKNAVVVYDADKVSSEKLISALKDTNYSASV